MFGRRRRRGWLLLPLLVAILAVGGTVGVSLRDGTDGGGGDPVSAAEPSPAITPTPDTATISPSPSPTPPSTDSVVTAADLVGDPQVDLTAQLPMERPALGPEEEKLRDRLRAIIRSQAGDLKGSEVTVGVRDDQGRRILDRGATRHLMPASTMKAVTSATVLAALGDDHRFTTTVAPTGEVVDGVVEGDLVLRGGGDPVLTTDDYRRWVYPARPATSIEDLADAVVEAGITRVTGRLVAESSGWNSPIAAGWRPSYLDDHNARRITELTVDAGLEVQVRQPEGRSPTVRLEGSEDPVRRAGRVFGSLLAERGVTAGGDVTTSTLPVATQPPVARVQSPPVADLLRFAMRRSDNHLADSMLRAAAAAATGSGSWMAADRTAAAVLGQLGLDPQGLRVADGSGLSRLDRVSAAQLADLDAAMMNSEYADVWHDSLAVAATSGTLSRRLVGTAGAGRFFGKTGTLDDVKAVVGHVLPEEPGASERLHVAVIANGVPSGGQWAVTVLMDRLELALVDHLDGCTTTWTGDGTAKRKCP